MAPLIDGLGAPGPEEKGERRPFLVATRARKCRHRAHHSALLCRQPGPSGRHLLIDRTVRQGRRTRGRHVQGTVSPDGHCPASFSYEWLQISSYNVYTLPAARPGECDTLRVHPGLLVCGEKGHDLKSGEVLRADTGRKTNSESRCSRSALSGHRRLFLAGAHAQQCGPPQCFAKAAQRPDSLCGLQLRSRRRDIISCASADSTDQHIQRLYNGRGPPLPPLRLSGPRVTKQTVQYRYIRDWSCNKDPLLKDATKAKGRRTTTESTRRRSRGSLSARETIPL